MLYSLFHGLISADVSPETVESLFLAYRSTGDEKYREEGWKIFQAFEKHCRVPHGGYASIENVETVPAVQVDKMETFWLVSHDRHLASRHRLTGWFPQTERDPKYMTTALSNKRISLTWLHLQNISTCSSMTAPTFP